MQTGRWGLWVAVVAASLSGRKWRRCGSDGPSAGDGEGGDRRRCAVPGEFSGRSPRTSDAAASEHDEGHDGGPGARESGGCAIG